jgi:hypothetical protein
LPKARVVDKPQGSVTREADKKFIVVVPSRRREKIE